MKRYIHHISTYVLLFLVSIAPQLSHAMSLTVSAQGTVHAKDVFILNVALDTEKQDINTVEGEITFTDSTKNFEIRDVVVAGSALTMWPRKPSLSVKGDTISFTGGIPGGISGSVPLFKIIVFVRNPSELRVTPENIVAYANDGKGTAISVTTKDTIISVTQPLADPVDQWKSVISADNTAPEIFEISLYQDSTLYDGKKFLSFPTIDAESGIAYYEVQEGGALPVRTGDQYVLVNQNHEEDIVVTAYDVAGNARSGHYTGKNGINWLAIILWTIVLAIIAKRKQIKRFFKKYKNKK